MQGLLPGLEFFFDGGGTEAGVSAEFFDGDELVFFFSEGFLYLLYEFAAVAFGFTGYYLYVFGINAQTFHCSNLLLRYCFYSIILLFLLAILLVVGTSFLGS